MSDYDWCAIFAVAGLIAVVAWYSCGPGNPDDQTAWDASTAARTEDEVRDAVAKIRETRQAFDQIIAAEYPKAQADIPQQTRRTEEDQ